MELPDDILALIREYSKPIGLRLDWRLGSYVKRHIMLELDCELTIQKYYMFRIVNAQFGSYMNFLSIHLS
jgi:hypothetical protein